MGILVSKLKSSQSYSTPPPPSKILTYNFTLPLDGWIYTGEGDDATAYDKKWRWDKYALIEVQTTTPTLEIFQGKTIIQTNYFLDSATSVVMNMYDNYSAIASCYVYFDQAATVSITQHTDDAGALYVNGELVGTNTSTGFATNVVTFKKGENFVQCLYHEGIGADGWEITPALYTIEGCKKMSAERIGYYSQTVTPIAEEVDYPDITSDFKVLGIAPQFSFTGSINNQGDAYDALDRMLIVPGDKEITFYQNYDLVNSDIKGYIYLMQLQNK